MKNIVLLIMLVISGFGLSSQASINGGLGRTIGALEAAFISFLMGTVSLFLMVAFFGKGNLFSVLTVSKWQLLGGIFGALYIGILAVAVPKIGVGLPIVLVVCGQMTMSLLIDNFGWFRSPQISLSWYRICGLILLIIAMGLIYKGTTGR